MNLIMLSYEYAVTIAWNPTQIEGDNLTISIKDLTGKIIANLYKNKLDAQAEWHTSQVENGIYFIELASAFGGNRQISKIIIQK